MRLFKLLILVIIIGSAYFFAKQQPDSASDWQTIKITHGVSIQFPQKPVSKSFQRNIPSLGKARLTTYQSIVDNKVFVLLWIVPLEKSPQQKNIPLSGMEDVVHAINDTTQLKISNKQAFVLQSHPGIEYKATKPNGDSVWCRTIKKGNQLISIIYASRSLDASTDANSDSNLASRDAFFRSLRI